MLQLHRQHPDGSQQLLDLNSPAPIAVTPGARYQLLAADTPLPFGDFTVTKEGDDLVVDSDGQRITTLAQFFGAEQTAYLLLPSSGSGEAETISSLDVALYPESGILWSAQQPGGFITPSLLADIGLVGTAIAVAASNSSGSDSAAAAADSAPSADRSVVVFDLSQGLSSDHSARSFDADSSYQIYIIVPTDASPLQFNTGQQWFNGNNLGADDKITLVGDDGAILSLQGHAEITNHWLYSSSSYYSWGNLDNPDAGSWAIYNLAASGLFSASFSSTTATIRASSYYLSIVTLWSGTAVSLSGGNQSFASAYRTALPAGILTSQGLA